jgi:hypothetical protein
MEMSPASLANPATLLVLHALLESHLDVLIAILLTIGNFLDLLAIACLDFIQIQTEAQFALHVQHCWRIAQHARHQGLLFVSHATQDSSGLVRCASVA